MYKNSPLYDFFRFTETQGEMCVYKRQTGLVAFEYSAKQVSWFLLESNSIHSESTHSWLFNLLVLSHLYIMTSVPPPTPASFLGRHRILSPSAGVRVSPLCLGAMNFGDAWKDVLGECSKETAFEMMDYFYSKGGNFIDTAVNYQFNQSEQWVGEWMEKRGNRDEMVIATKFTGSQRSHEKGIIYSNFGGNSAKNIHTSIERSLKQLRTSYIDLVCIQSNFRRNSI
jgi:hypothetical protein